jgi:hypothetical protein
VAQCKVLIGCMFMGIVTESETCHIYKAVLQTIKVATHDLSGELNFLQHNTRRRVITSCSSSRLILYHHISPDPNPNMT